MTTISKDTVTITMPIIDNSVDFYIVTVDGIPVAVLEDYIQAVYWTSGGSFQIDNIGKVVAITKTPFWPK
jgi:hypothetical protein